jgi:hypothetical protein
VTAPARVVFALLVLATFGAFFAVQRLKSTPPAVQTVGVSPFFSPNRDGRFDRARITFSLKHTDDVTVNVVDRRGDQVRRLLEPRPLRARVQLPALRWDGLTDAGARAPDGIYRVRVGLRRQGRSVLLPRSVRLDTLPPRVRVVAVGPTRSTLPAPELLPRPGGGPAVVHFAGPTRRAQAFVFRTDPLRRTPVASLRVHAERHRAEWDGAVRGRRVRPGTYLVAVLARDQAGNIGSSVPEVRPTGRSAVIARGFTAGRVLPGRAGITVRYVAAQPPLAPILTGRLIRVGVDARREPYRWSLRRLGRPRPIRRGRKTAARLSIHAPGEASGLYVLDLRAGTHTAAVPIAVQARRRSRILVVLPAITWQGTNPLDDDGDGLPNMLTTGLPVRRERVLAHSGLPPGISGRIAPLLIHLDRRRLRYDLTTDLALAARGGPPLSRYRGVALAGDERWLPRNLASALRRFVRRGGRVASFGTESLRRSVRLTPRRLASPGPLAASDVFGARLRPLVRRPVTLLVFPGDEIGLFSGAGGLLAGGRGLFEGYRAYEETAAVGSSAELVAAAGPRTGRPVIVAARYGRGLVIRTGLPEFGRRLSRDPESAGLLRRVWTLLGR